jgi:hypothetical protein
MEGKEAAMIVAVRQGSTTVIEKVTVFAMDVYGEGKDAIMVPVWTPA